MKNIRIRKGITLVALVVTIIVLLILSGITVSLVIGDNGILRVARNSKVEKRIGDVDDKIRLRETQIIIANERGEDGESINSFLDYLKSEGLFLDAEDAFDKITNTIKIAKQKDGTYLFEKQISDGKSLAKAIKSAKQDESNAMILKIRTTTANEKVEIPLWAVSNEISIKWGDGNITSPVTANHPTNVYKTPGEYYVYLIGKTTKGQVGKSAYDYVNKNIVGIVSWGENNFTGFGGFGRSLEGEIPIPQENSFKYAKYMTNTFLECLNLKTTIPSNLFESAVNVERYYATFRGCNNLFGEIPEQLFANSPKVTDMYGIFYACRNLTRKYSKRFI